MIKMKIVQLASNRGFAVANPLMFIRSPSDYLINKDGIRTLQVA
jgi:hypothetical protein